MSDLHINLRWRRMTWYWYGAFVALLACSIVLLSQCVVPAPTAVVHTGSYVATAADTGEMHVMNCASACALTLPNPVHTPNWLIWVVAAAAGEVAVSANGQQLDGKTAKRILSNATIISRDGTNYRSIVASNDAQIVYLASTGSDSNNGVSLNLAKATISGACAALPGGNANCTAGYGTIYEIGSGDSLPSGTSPTIRLEELSLGETGGPTSGPLPYIDFRTFGGRVLGSAGNTAATSVTTTAGSSNVTITNPASWYAPRESVVIPTAGAATTQTTPPTPDYGIVGANGTSTINYKCVGVDSRWGLTAASPARTVTNAPAVFGWKGFNISSAVWRGGTVTVNTSSAMPVSRGNYHVMLSNFVSGGAQIGGVRYVTVTGSTTFTYRYAGSGTITTTSAVGAFVNAFVITQASETAGSNDIVLRTDVNHNIAAQNSAWYLPSKVFLDGINFAGEPLPAYANGPFNVKSVTSNTITVTTPWTAKLTQNATSSASNSTAKVNQMVVLAWPEIMVECGGNANGNGTPVTGGVYYAVYADYGSGYAPIGFTQWEHSRFFDYGPGYTQSGFTPPPAMNLPATPPSSPQNQVFEGQIVSMSSNSMTLDRNVPSTVTVSSYHSNGIALQNALKTACTRSDGYYNGFYYPVLIPNEANYYYYFNAPVDLSLGGHCSKANILQSGNIWTGGTFMNSAGGQVNWAMPHDIGSWYYYGMGGGQAVITGPASPMMATPTVGVKWRVEGINFVPVSNGQNSFVNLVEHSDFVNDSFVASCCASSTPLVLGGGGFDVRLRDISFGGAASPIGWPCGNCGETMYWPVPAIQVNPGPSNMPNVVWEGINYGSFRGMAVEGTYPGEYGNYESFEIAHVKTFQEPWQPMLTLEGWNAPWGTIELNDVVMDSIQMPLVAGIMVNSGLLIVKNSFGAGSYPGLTGNPFSAVVNFSSSRMQTNEVDMGTPLTVGMPLTTSSERTTSQCFSSASPAICGSNIDGFVVIAAGTSSVVVNTTAVTGKSTISLTFDATQGTNVGVTCNTAPQAPYVSARVAGTSFTVAVPSNFSTNPGCVGFHLKN